MFPLSTDGQRILVEASNVVTASSFSAVVTNLNATQQANVLAALVDQVPLNALWESNALVHVVGGATPNWLSRSRGGAALQQVTVGNRPLFNANGGPNNLPWIQTDGVDDVMRCVMNTTQAGFPSPNYSPYTQPPNPELFMVARMVAAGATGTIIDSATTTNTNRIRRSAANTFSAELGGGAAIAVADATAWHFFRTLSSPANAADAQIFQVDNLFAFPGTGVAAAIAGWQIGVEPAATDFGAVGIACIIDAPFGLNTFERNMILSYIASKYGVTVQ